MIYYHADDYGVSLSQSEIIKECYEQGVLNSVSIMPNSDKRAECYELIRRQAEDGVIRVVVHLNLIEGYSLTAPELIPALVNKEGKLCCSFLSVLKMNYSGKRAGYKEQLKKEIAAQIKAVVDLTGNRVINVDSHQHFHMIPIVWEALMEVISEEGYTLSYLRISHDPLSLLVTTPSVWKYLKPVNLIKWMILSFLCPGKKECKRTGANIPVFMGMFYTCEMRWDVIKVLLPKYQSYAEKAGRDLELMFHPGAVMSQTELLDADNQELVEFYASPNRAEEKNTLMMLKS